LAPEDEQIDRDKLRFPLRILQIDDELVGRILESAAKCTCPINFWPRHDACVILSRY
jgi:hypothetical protein